MKSSLFLLLICFSFISFSQTNAIAYKSHSGNMKYFIPSGTDNLGIVEPPPALDSIVKINASTVVKYFSFMGNEPFNDTIINDRNWLKPDLNLDSIRKVLYNPNIIFRGFETQTQTQTQNVVKITPKKSWRHKRTKKQKQLQVAKPKTNRRISI